MKIRLGTHSSTVPQIPKDQRPAATKVVNKQNTQELSGQRNNRIARLVQQRLLRAHPNLRKDRWTVILDRADSRQLNTRLQRDAQQHSSEITLAPEQLPPRLGRVLMLERNLLLNLLELRAHPRVLLVAVCVEFGQGRQSFAGAVVVNEPAWGFREEEDEQTEDGGRDTLDSERDAPLPVVGGREALVGAEADPRGAESTDS